MQTRNWDGATCSQRQGQGQSIRISTAASTQRTAPSPRMAAPSDDGLDRRLDSVIAEAESALKGRQQPEGHWQYDLEADATIPTEFILLTHFLGELDGEAQRKVAHYLRD